MFKIDINDFESENCPENVIISGQTNMGKTTLALSVSQLTDKKILFINTDSNPANLKHLFKNKELKGRVLVPTDNKKMPMAITEAETYRDIIEDVDYSEVGAVVIDQIESLYSAFVDDFNTKNPTAHFSLKYADINAIFQREVLTFFINKGIHLIVVSNLSHFGY